MSLAFVFPGQGSQSVGMLSQLAKEFPQVQATFDEASKVLGYDLWELVSSGPAETLNKTDHTQPAMLAAGIAVWRCWQSVSSVTPDYFAGHSLGEYSALVAAGSLNFSDAIKLVELRGQFMQQAVPVGTGAMAAILGLEDDIVKDVCSQAAGTGVVEAVNFNSPGQVVIAGEADLVNKAIELATLMKPAAEKLAQALADVSVSMPTIPVIHNSNISQAKNEQEIRDLLAAQLQSPVRWVETVQGFAAQGVDKLVECGPGKVLAGLTRRIDKSITGLAVFDSTSLEKAIKSLEEETS